MAREIEAGAVHVVLRMGRVRRVLALAVLIAAGFGALPALSPAADLPPCPGPGAASAVQEYIASECVAVTARQEAAADVAHSDADMIIGVLSATVVTSGFALVMYGRR
jgi:hypothetical protein